MLCSPRWPGTLCVAVLEDFSFCLYAVILSLTNVENVHLASPLCEH